MSVTQKSDHCLRKLSTLDVREVDVLPFPIEWIPFIVLL